MLCHTINDHTSTEACCVIMPDKACLQCVLMRMSNIDIVIPSDVEVDDVLWSCTTINTDYETPPMHELEVLVRRMRDVAHTCSHKVLTTSEIKRITFAWDQLRSCVQRA